ncbi:hypothetical protein BDQ12DRAFT_668984 [Crucibulum laeve]|uniref:Uncharacterized protein n=1 Tax=Crucibulum laeve TaxID=68775 RepID=A0A5C3LSE0_9AGAR|nr:hypothetical protein BDQ12DRAFT_668984 [Crucibulum laeve]
MLLWSNAKILDRSQRESTLHDPEMVHNPEISERTHFHDPELTLDGYKWQITKYRSHNPEMQWLFLFNDVSNSYGLMRRRWIDLENHPFFMIQKCEFESHWEHLLYKSNAKTLDIYLRLRNNKLFMIQQYEFKSHWEYYGDDVANFFLMHLSITRRLYITEHVYTSSIYQDVYAMLYQEHTSLFPVHNGNAPEAFIPTSLPKNAS